MGQNASVYKKSYSSTVFGYTKVTSIKYIQDMDENHVLFKPFIYNSSNPTVTTLFLQDENDRNSKTDVGYYLKENEYVDQQDDNIELFGVPITFQNILFMNNSNIYNLFLARRGFKILTPNIALFSTIRKLDLSYNELREIPKEIGHLHQLEKLLLSHNQLTSIPDTICHLTKLNELNLSHNQINQLTPFISHLKKLQSLNLEHNQLNQFDICLDYFLNLNTLDLSHNPITVIPAEVIQLPLLRRLRLEGCAFMETSKYQDKLSHDPPSLLETCARIIIKHEDQILQKTNPDTLKSYLTDSLVDYLSKSKKCSFCHGPYFDSFVSRGRWIERNDIWIPLEYKLCSAHWSDEQDRMYAFFSTGPRKSCTISNNKILSSFALSKPELPPLANSLNATKAPMSSYLTIKRKRKSPKLVNTNSLTDSVIISNSVTITSLFEGK